jgi:hypothetical protein
MNDNDDDKDVIIDHDDDDHHHHHHDHDILTFIIQPFTVVLANGYNCNWQTFKYAVNTKKLTQKNKTNK